MSADHSCIDMACQALTRGVALAREQNPEYDGPVNAQLLSDGALIIEAYTGDMKVFGRSRLATGLAPEDLERSVQEKADSLIRRILGKEGSA